MRSNSHRRVVVTGIGLITPLGGDVTSSWMNIQGGVSGLHWLPDISSSRSIGMRAGGCCLWNDATAVTAFEQSPLTSLAVTTAAEALRDGKFNLQAYDKTRFGCVTGISKGSLQTLQQALAAVHHNRHAAFPAQWFAHFPAHVPGSVVANTYDLQGPLLCPVAACATGLMAIMRGAELIRDGYCDTVLAGSCDASLQPILLAAFDRMGVLAKRFDDPQSACRPFAEDRNGFLVGEGGAMLLLEDAKQAEERGVHPYPEWMSGGTVADLSSMTALDPDVTSLTWLIQDVLNRAGMQPVEIDYVNLHGTATHQNDLCETRAIRQACGTAAEQFACSSIKGAIGHLLGAAGSVETAITLLAMRDGIVPPTLNLKTPDPACDLNYTPLHAVKRNINSVLKLSLGFGGHLAAAVLKKVE